jgi:hypothetical protein
MIVEPKVPATVQIPIGAFDTPLMGQDRFLPTVANRINGKSSRKQASHAGIETMLRARIRYSVSDHILRSQFV